MKTAGDNYLQYMMGFHAGAGCKSIDPKRANHKDKEFAALYNEGWKDGRTASHAASMRAAERFGYVPSVIRTMS